jgi:hypothetical protein
MTNAVFSIPQFLNLRMCALVKNLQLLEILVFRFSFLRTCIHFRFIPLFVLLDQNLYLGSSV